MASRDSTARVLDDGAKEIGFDTTLTGARLARAPTFAGTSTA
jgi:hypothetical protein